MELSRDSEKMANGKDRPKVSMGLKDYWSLNTRTRESGLERL